MFDQVYGAVVVISAGGVLLELLDDQQHALAPFNADTAMKLLRKMRLWKLLQGVRGKPGCDIAAICNTIAVFSEFVHQFRHLISEIDINPLIVSPDGCIAVDALIIPSIE